MEDRNTGMLTPMSDKGYILARSDGDEPGSGASRWPA